MPTNVKSPPDHRTLPRKKRSPSLRDQAILVAYRAQGRSQAELAKDYRLSQSRVSAIVRRVERWRADQRPGVESEFDHAQQSRLDRWLERERSQAIYDRAIRAFDHGPKELTTIRSGQRDGKPFQEETLRQRAPDMQALRIAARANTDLGRATARCEPLPDEQDPAQSREMVRRVLGQLRGRAMHEEKVAFDLNPEVIADDLIKTFLGEPNRGIADVYRQRDKELQARLQAEVDKSTPSKSASPD